MIHADGLDQLTADLAAASRMVQVRAPLVLEEAGRRVRDDARRLAPRRMLPHYAATITSETRWTGGAAEAEIGPEKGGQGSLGHILEYGTAKTPPRAHLGPALDLEGPRLERAISDLAERAL